MSPELVSATRPPEFASPPEPPMAEASAEFPRLPDKERLKPPLPPPPLTD